MSSLRITSQRFSNISRAFLQAKRTPIIRRNLGGNISGAYEADGKTIGKVINKAQTDTLTVDSVTSMGFTLTNRMTVVGPVIMFPHTMLSWNIQSAADINEDSLSLFTILEPKIEMLVIGFGNRDEYTRDIQFQILNACRKLKLNYEAMTTEDAVATFNFLSLDRRFVAGAFVPPAKLTFYGMDKTLEQLEIERDDEIKEIDYDRLPRLKFDNYKKKKFGQEEA